MKEMIAEKLNSRLKADVVKNIFFVVARVVAEGIEEESTPPSPKRAESSAPLLEDGFLDSISDPELKQAFKKLLKSYSRRKQSS
jgi:hypothetical protein